MSNNSEKPANANEECVGPSSEQAGKASTCAGCPNQKLCASGEMQKRNPALDAINETLSQVKKVLLVLSGKGGVGKSTFSAQLAFALARQGNRVGLLDIDICGPSIPLMLGLKGQEGKCFAKRLASNLTPNSVKQSASGWQPVYVDLDADDGVEIDQCELGVMSIGFLMPDPDSAVIWRGPKKNGLIQQFFTSVDWGELDYMVVDTPPGTSDEHISIVQLLKESLKPGDGAIIVTTPQEVAMMDVRKELNFCKQTKLNVLGVVENMSTTHLSVHDLKFLDKDGNDMTESTLKTMKEACPMVLDRLVEISLFPAAGGGPRQMAKKFGVPYLGCLPVDSELQKAGELGIALSKGRSIGALREIVIQLMDEKKSMNNEQPIINGGSGTITA